MIPRRDRDENPKIDVVIDNLLSEMTDLKGYDEDYPKYAEHLDKLYKIKRSNDPESPVDLNTVLIVAGNVSVALLILGFEQKNVITTKVLGFLSKLR